MSIFHSSSGSGVAGINCVLWWRMCGFHEDLGFFRASTEPCRTRRAVLYPASSSIAAPAHLIPRFPPLHLARTVKQDLMAMWLADPGSSTQLEPEARAVVLAKMLHNELVQHQESCWMGKRYVDCCYFFHQLRKAMHHSSTVPPLVRLMAF